MAIEKRYARGFGQYYTLVCDSCGKEKGVFDDFYEAVDKKRDYGFRSVRVSGSWEDACEDCYALAGHGGTGSTAAEDFADFK